MGNKSKLYPKSTYRLDNELGMIFDEADRIIGEFVPGRGRSIKGGIPFADMAPPKIIPKGFNALPTSRVAPTTPGAPESTIDAFLNKGKPNFLQALGSGMAGFAAPFLGQQWKPPDYGGDNNVMDYLKFIALQEQRGLTQENRETTQDLQYEKTAFDRAYKEFGGSMMAPIKLKDPEQRKKFYARVEEIKAELKKGKTGGAEGISEEMDVDYGDQF